MRAWIRRARPNGMRQCADCGEEKPEDEFYTTRGGKYFQACCKPCSGERTKAYRATRTDLNARLSRRSYVKNWAARTLVRLRKRAVEMALPFDLHVSDIVVPARCPVLGIAIVIGEGIGRPNSPSVDRIIPRLGYVRGNIAVISMRANAIKNDASIAEHEAVIRWMRAQRQLRLVRVS